MLGRGVSTGRKVLDVKPSRYATGILDHEVPRFDLISTQAVLIRKTSQLRNSRRAVGARVNVRLSRFFTRERTVSRSIRAAIQRRRSVWENGHGASPRACLRRSQDHPVLRWCLSRIEKPQFLTDRDVTISAGGRARQLDGQQCIDLMVEQAAGGGGAGGAA